jgi:hypothetical protein
MFAGFSLEEFYRSPEEGTLSKRAANPGVAQLNRKQTNFHPAASREQQVMVTIL